MKHWILDNGHGGVLGGEYQTKGKRSPIWPDGSQLFEGVFNRQVVHVISNLLKQEDIPHTVLVPSKCDVSLRERVRRINRLCLEYGDAALMSVHANAGGGTGFEVFTSVGETESDKIAEVFCECVERDLPEFKFRKDLSDGDSDKESPFYLLEKSHCPAILTENLFMDNYEDYKLMCSSDMVVKIAIAHVETILKYENLI